MAINKVKGVSLLMSISSVYTAIPQMTSLDKSGEAAESLEVKTFDSKRILHPASGHVDSPTIKFGIYYDAANAVHLALKALARTPVDTNFKLTGTDSGPLSEIWNVTTVGFDEKYEAGNAIKADITLQCSGDPT